MHIPHNETFMDSIKLARQIRVQALQMVARSNSSHIGSALSMVDLLAVCYANVLRIDPHHPDWPNRDRFILSKGHATAALYATLALRGFFPIEWLAHYAETGSPLLGHASHHVPGVELSTGSLGHGLPVACGLALAGKRESQPCRVFALLGDGECDEGSNWEAALFAAHHKLDNLVAIIDSNRLQGFGFTEEVLNLEPLADKWRAFGWVVNEVDGHDHVALLSHFERIPFTNDRPSLVLARTIKGKGVSFMEGQLVWHYKSPNAEQLARALRELGEDGP